MYSLTSGSGATTVITSGSVVRRALSLTLLYIPYPDSIRLLHNNDRINHFLYSIPEGVTDHVSRVNSTSGAMQDSAEKKRDGDRADEHAPLISYPFKGNTKTVNLTGSDEALDTKQKRGSK